MKPELKTTTVDAQSTSRSPLVLLGRSFRNMVDGHSLAMRFTIRNLKGQYRQSLLGFAWALIPPFAIAAIWIFLRSKGVLSTGDLGMPYPFFVFTGSLMWQMFAEAIQSPLKNVSSNQKILTKVNFPREALLLSGFYELLFNTAIKVLIIVLLLFHFGVEFNSQIAWFPLGIIVLLIVGFTLGTLLTPIGLLYNDVSKGLPVVLPFLLYLSPVIYPVGNEEPGILFRANPASVLIDSSRAWLSGQTSSLQPDLWIHAAIFLVLFLVSLVVYRATLPIIIERIGS